MHNDTLMLAPKQLRTPGDSYRYTEMSSTDKSDKGPMQFAALIVTESAPQNRRIHDYDSFCGLRIKAEADEPPILPLQVLTFSHTPLHSHSTTSQPCNLLIDRKLQKFQTRCLPTPIAPKTNQSTNPSYIPSHTLSPHQDRPCPPTHPTSPT